MNTYTVLYARDSYYWHFKSATSFQAFDAYAMINPVLEASDMEDVFVKMQGECWSPNGEARNFLSAISCYHTSMSVGDIIINNQTLEAYRVAGEGFDMLDWTKSQIITLCDYLKNSYNEATMMANEGN